MSQFEPQNPVKSQDRVFDLIDTFNRYGYAMFPQQRAIYQFLAEEIGEGRIIDVGCGNGVGTAMLQGRDREVIGVDLVERNVAFAKELYPSIEFRVGDVCSCELFADVITAVEVFEHVADPESAIRNFSDSCYTLWLSTPNGRGKTRPPSNPYHVYEFTKEEIEELVRYCSRPTTEIRWFEEFEDPMLCRITF